MLAPRIEGHSEALLRLGLNSLELYDSFITRVATDAQRRIEYRRSGTLQVAGGFPTHYLTPQEMGQFLEAVESERPDDAGEWL